MPETTVIVRVEDELKTAFVQAAKAADRTASQVLRAFMRDYVRQQSDQAAYDAWLGKKVEFARGAVSRAHVRSGEEVEAHFARRRAQSPGNPDETDV